MQITVRSATKNPSLQPFAARRLRAATQRLAHRLRRVEVDVARVSPREGGTYVCSVRASLARGGELVTTREDKDAKVAIGVAIERFRRSLVRHMERSSTQEVRRRSVASGL
jgi:ribosome-associated translation inhibitor RaiA